MNPYLLLTPGAICAYFVLVGIFLLLIAAVVDNVDVAVSLFIAGLFMIMAAFLAAIIMASETLTEQAAFLLMMRLV